MFENRPNSLRAMAESSEVPASAVEQPKVEAKAEGAEVEKDQKKKEKTGKGKGGGKGKGKVEGFRLNVKNLAEGITTEQLKALFSPFGTVVAVEVKFKEDGHSRGFGFVIFSTEEESKKAMADMNNKEIGGKQLNVGPAERREGEDGKKGKGKGAKGDGKDGKRGRAPSGPFGGGSGFRLNVKNLSGDTLAEKLRELFEPFGTVTDAQVKLKDDGKSRGFGFVIFSTEDEGRKAMTEMDGKEVGRGGGKISVVPAERRVEEEDDVMMGGKGKGKKGAVGVDLPAQQAAYAAYMQQMVMMQQAAYMHQAAAMWGGNPYGGFPPMTPGEYDGTIKSLIQKGHGFIECPQTFVLYNCDIYIDLTTVPKGAVVGSRVKFTVSANPGEHPKAATAKLA